MRLLRFARAARRPRLPNIRGRIVACRFNCSIDETLGGLPLTIDTRESRRKAQLDALLLTLPGVSARTINSLDAYFVTDKMFACISGDGVGLRLPVATATELSVFEWPRRSVSARGYGEHARMDTDKPRRCGRLRGGSPAFSGVDRVRQSRPHALAHEARQRVALGSVDDHPRNTVDMKSPEPTVAAVVRQQTGVAWSRARGLCTEGRVTVNGERCLDPASRVSPGTVVAVDRRAPKLRTGPLAESAIVFCDRDVVVVDKPAGMLSVADEPGNKDTLVDHTRTLLRRMGGRGVDAKLGVVHRLDKDTSGLIDVCADGVMPSARWQRSFATTPSIASTMPSRTGLSPRRGSRRISS